MIGDTRNVYPEKENSRILLKDGSLAPMTFKATDTFQIYSTINQICCVYDSFPSSYMYIWIHLTNDAFTDCMPVTLLCTENLGLNKTDKLPCLRNLALLFCILLYYPLPSYVFHLLLNSISPKNSLSSTPGTINNRFTAPPTQTHTQTCTTGNAVFLYLVTLSLLLETSYFLSFIYLLIYSLTIYLEPIICQVVPQGLQWWSRKTVYYSAFSVLSSYFHLLSYLPHPSPR